MGFMAGCRDISMVGGSSNLVVSESTRAYIAAIAGSLPNNNAAEIAEKIKDATPYLEFLRQQIQDYPPSALSCAFVHQTTSSSAKSDTMLDLMTHIVREFAADEQHSIDSLIHTAQEAKIIRRDHTIDSETGKPFDLHQKAAHIVFAAIGWLTMFYTPAKPINDSHASDQDFRISYEHPKTFLRSSQSIEMASRPIAELLRGFGELLPGPRHYPHHISEETSSDDALYVSNLNISTLISVGSVKICWVNCMSSHLEFNNATSELLLFSLPSFCMLGQSDRSFLCRALNNYYDQWTRPDGFSTSSFTKEILLTYRLLISSNKRSRHLYESKERDRALTNSRVTRETTLDQVCGVDRNLGSGSRPMPNLFCKKSDFPIFAQRLSEIQDYIVKQKPNKTLTLWRDRRDLLRWYTLWAVLIIGIVGLFLAIVQVILSALQVSAAWHANELAGLSIPEGS